MSATVTSDIRPLPLDALVFSQTTAQKERRAHFDKAKLQELAESLKSVGLLQPIVVRPSPFREVNEDLFEVVAGERRVAASKLAGLQEILASVRDLDDHQVAKIQLIENLQREDVHPLAEAEGYDELLKQHGYTIEQLAAEVGKSKAYVYARLKLLALDPASREAFYRSELNASTALLIARIPVASLQREACGEITHPRWGEPMSYREAVEHIQDKYMLRLADAPFPTDREDLGRNVGACGACPKRTGNQPELFGDIKGADVCTDPTCFKAKREAWGKLQLQQAKAAGRKVITGTDAKKIAPYGEHSSLASGYAKLDDKCWDDPKSRTYRQILGKDAQPAFLQMPKSGDVIEIVSKGAALTKLKASGVIKPEKRQPSSPNASADQKAAQALCDRLFVEIHKRAPTKLSLDSLRSLVEHEMDVVGQIPEMLEKAWGWDADTFNTEKLTEGQLHQLLWELLIVGELPDRFGMSDKLLNLAKSLKIDVKRIRTEIAAEQKAATAAPAKASKKKARK